MGGGDLNLKKSWHPNTMKNMERVWKAEQKDTEERKRIAELQKEIHAERDKEDMQKFAENTGVVKKKDDLKLEWMYKGPSQSVNREDYLLGKAIDKTFEKYNSEQNGGPSASQDEERLPGAIREAKSSMLNDQVDMVRKMNEDPLNAIRQRAVEKAKQLYNNPVRLKQIQKMVASKSEEKKDKKKKKKSKKSSKKDDDKMLDALLTERLKHALKDRDMFRKLKKKAKRDSSESSSSSSGSDDESHAEQRQKRHSGDPQGNDRDISRDYRKRSCSPLESNDRGKKFSSNSYDHRDARRKSRSPRPSNSHDYSSRRKSRSRSREREKYSSRKEQQMKHYDSKGGKSNRRESSPAASGYRKREHSPERRKTYKDRSPLPSEDRREDKGTKARKECSPSSDDYDSDDNPKKKRSYGLVMADGSKPVKKNNPVLQEVKPVSSQPKPTPWQRKEKVKLTEEEKERRRLEMMNNASWRDKEREETVRRYRIEEDREKKQHQEDFDDDFARKQFSKATEQASVEGRIKSKLNTIQRSKMAMDQNFARR